MFNVAGRPLGLKFDSAQILIPQNESFTVSASVWDEALDEAASGDVLTTTAWDCYAYLMSGNLSGTTNITVPMGNLLKISHE